jgi:CRP-like cAMP-binding protein/DNA-binding SARP family transcriptional activator
MGRETITKMKAEAAELVVRGKLDDALKLYRKVVQLDPQDTKTWVRIGDLYRKLGRKDQAVEIYAKGARAFALSGQLMQAISVCKMILELAPKHEETQRLLAELYSKREEEQKRGEIPGVRGASPDLLKLLKKKESPPPPPEVKIEEVQAPAPPPRPSFESLELDEEAELDALFSQIMNQEEVVVDLPEEGSEEEILNRLPRIPLFSSLTREEFLEVLEKIQLLRFDVGDRIIREGEPGDAFYIIARGSARVTKKDPQGREIELSIIREGEFFGEFAFFSRSYRHASVTVTEEMEALKITWEDLEEILARYPRLKGVLIEFYRERLIGTLLAISPLFQPLPPQTRRELLERFEPMEVEPGTVIIRQGEEGKGLYVIASGEIAVSLRSGGKPIELARLKEGEFFGEISLLTDQPTTANCIAVKPSLLFWLKREVFQELIVTYPPVVEVLSRFAEERMRVTGPYLAKGEDLTRAGLL